MSALTRRAFVGIGVAAAFGALGGVAWASTPDAGLLRPPVVDDETAFAARCLRCYRCIEACPTKAVRPADFEGGIVAVGTPVMDFHRGICNFCNACVDACPTAALRPADPDDPASGRIGVAQIQPDRCIAFEYGCDVCEKACPYEAIELADDGTPRVVEERCNGCGACENQCPALVLRSFGGGTRRGVVIVAEAAAGAAATALEER